MSRIWDTTLAWAMGLFLIGSLLLINVLQMLSVLIWPFSKHGFRRVNRFLANLWWSMARYCVEGIRGIEVHFSGDDVPVEENAIVMCNHQQMPDVPVLFCLAAKKKRLGDMKWFVKDALKYAPGVGWGMLFLDCLFVKRTWGQDERLIRRTFEKFHRERIPVWLMIFPEGTRFRPHKLVRCHAIAKAKGLPVTRNVLLPRAKGLVASIMGLRGHAQAVYDVTIRYDGPVPTLPQFLAGKTRKVYVHVRRIDLANLPLDEKSLTQWLYQCFAEKDDTFEALLSTSLAAQ